MVEDNYLEALHWKMAEVIDLWYISIKDVTSDKRIGFKKELLKQDVYDSTNRRLK
jgi:hypothetical protein